MSSHEDGNTKYELDKLTAVSAMYSALCGIRKKCGVTPAAI